MGRAKLRATALVLVAVPILSNCTAHKPTRPEGASSSLPASAAGRPVVAPLVGKGPFVVFNMNIGDSDYQAFAIDISSKKRLELPSGWIGASLGSGYTIS